MMGSLIILGGVGVMYGAGIAVSSALKFFMKYDFDFDAKLKESKKQATKKEREAGGGEHELRMERLFQQGKKH